MQPRTAAIALAVGLAFSMPAYAQFADIDQDGINNNASIVQDGATGSRAAVRQRGDDNGPSPFMEGKVIEQSLTLNSSAEVSQTGKGNGGTVLQVEASGAWGLLQQVGSANNGVVTQRFSDAAVGRIYQGGVACLTRVCEGEGVDFGESTNNIAGVFQYFGAMNTAIIAQGGISNRADVDQQSGPSGGNSVLVQQTGQGNAIFVRQGGVFFEADGAVMGLQAPVNSRAFVSQTLSGQDAQVFQGGTAEAFVQQSGISGNEIVVLQDGNGNSVFTTQHGNGGEMSLKNIASIRQTGSNMQAGVTQIGTGNNASIVQR